MISVGDVIYIYEGGLITPNMKYMVCIVVSESYFFRINSKGHWFGSLDISTENYDFLKHDSFIECGSIIEVYEGEIEESIKDGESPVGKISPEDIQRIIEHIPNVGQLNEREKTLILKSLKSALEDV